MTEHQSQYLLVYTALVAVAVLIEAIALGALAFAMAKLIRQISILTEEAKGKVYPLIDTVHQLTEKSLDIADIAHDVVEDASPKIKHVINNVAETSDVYRAKVAEVDALITDTTQKAKRQSDRVDGMVTGVITRTGEVAGHIQHAIMQPAKQMAGIINGAKTTIESLLGQFGPKSRPTKPRTPKPVAFEGESVYTGLEDDYHA